jgi:hypothetical protein
LVLRYPVISRHLALLSFLLKILVYFESESEENSFDRFRDHFDYIFDVTWTHLHSYLLKDLLIKSIPVVSLLLDGMSA